MMVKESNELLGFDDEYHRHCDMCEKPTKEWFICEECDHVECIKCNSAYFELDAPMGHPCEWIRFKNKLYSGVA